MQGVWKCGSGAARIFPVVSGFFGGMEEVFPGSVQSGRGCVCSFTDTGTSDPCFEEVFFHVANCFNGVVDGFLHIASAADDMWTGSFAVANGADDMEISFNHTVRGFYRIGKVFHYFFETFHRTVETVFDAVKAFRDIEKAFLHAEKSFSHTSKRLYRKELWLKSVKTCAFAAEMP